MSVENETDSESNNPALVAAYAGSMEFVVPFIQEAGSATYANKNGDTMLHAASDGWQFRMVEYLAISGADPSAQINQGNTPLHMVTRRSTAPGDGKFIPAADLSSARSRTFAELLFRRSNPSIKNHQGATPLHLAAWNGDLDAVLELARLSNIDDLTTKGATALALAVLNGHPLCAKKLIDFGASLDAVLPSGQRILDAIVENDSAAMRSILT